MNDTENTLASQGREAVADGVRRTRSAVESAAESGEKVAAKAQDVAGNVAEQAKSQVASAAEQHKGAMTSMIGDIADAVQTAAAQLRDKQQTQAAEYADSIGAGLSGISRTLDRKSAGDMVSDLTGFAREHPAAYLGGALLVGMALARFGKASSPND